MSISVTVLAHMSNPQTSDGTKVGLGQTSDLYKLRTGTFIKKMVEFGKKTIVFVIRNKLKITHLL